MSQDHRELMREALRELQKSRARIAELEQQQRARAGEAALAIVGLGCRLPRGIDDPEALWRFFLAGGEATGPVPADRWASTDTPEPLPPGAFLPDPFGFDAQFFRIAPREARVIDPQQRLLLELAHATIEHAGLSPASLRGSRTGVFVGISTDDYSQHLTRHLPVQDIDGAVGPGTNACAAAGRISFCLGLEGPSFAVNTACSSSLVALHLAAQSLHAGEGELALVLGVNVMLSPFTTLTFLRAGMLSADGRCKTFTARADGYGRGEGAVAVLLATPAAVRRLGLRVHAELLGSAVNQDGATAGLTVPSGPAQQRVMRQALAAAGLRPADVQLVETHGTGTLLGDPIEANALAAVFAEGRAATDPLQLGASKANFGHLEAAAGLLAVQRAVLQLTHRTVAPHPDFSTKNPHVAWPMLPLSVPTKRAPWPAADRAVAGVSSFSFTGTNAHVLLGAVAPAAASSPQPSPAAALVLPLSARTKDALAAVCQRLHDHLAAHGELCWPDICATMAVGRSAHRCRAAVVAASLADALPRLAALTACRESQGALLARAEAVDPTPFPGPLDDPDALAAAFVGGLEVPWARVYAAPFRRQALPTYPFQRRTFRVAARPQPAASAEAGAAAADAVPAGSLRQRLAAAHPSAHAVLCAAHVRVLCAELLRLSPDDLGDGEPLADHGFDSMRAVELATRLEDDLGQPLPRSAIGDGTTARDVGEALARLYAGAAAAAAAGPAGALLQQIEAMSAEEVLRRLRETKGHG